jgi:NADPH:quinone reductase-like Zn-dependent oxidoreductase
VTQGGSLITYGLSSTADLGASPARLAWWLLRLRLWSWWPSTKTMRAYSIMALRSAHPELYRRDLETLFGLLHTHALKPRIEARIGLGDIANAHRRLDAGGLTGRIVACP